MRDVLRLVVAGMVFTLIAGCGGKTTDKPGTEPEKTGGGKSFEAALKACDRLGINVTSTRPGSIINGIIPESTEAGQIIVNMTFSGGRVNIQFFNAPEVEGWEAAWRKKIVNAIEAAGSAKKPK
jgi:hypothetical protein